MKKKRIWMQPSCDVIYLHCCYLRIRGDLDDAGDEVGAAAAFDFCDNTVVVFTALDALHPQVLWGHLELI